MLFVIDRRRRRNRHRCQVTILSCSKLKPLFFHLVSFRFISLYSFDALRMHPVLRLRFRNVFVSFFLLSLALFVASTFRLFGIFNWLFYFSRCFVGAIYCSFDLNANARKTKAFGRLRSHFSDKRTVLFSLLFCCYNAYLITWPWHSAEAISHSFSHADNALHTKQRTLFVLFARLEISKLNRFLFTGLVSHM